MTIAVVTGASSGIGEATARRLAREPDMTLVLVARREARLRALAEQLGEGTTYLAADLTYENAPARVAAHLHEHHGGRLDLLVNNAGAAWRGEFGDAGWENVRKTMELNFDAVVRLTEALLPLLRASAREHSPATSAAPAIVNVASTAGRVARGGSSAYSASKFALAGWSDGLHLEERAHGVHVGLVLPGFIKTEGFPASELPSLIVSKPEKVAQAILDCGPGGKAERYVPRPYALAGILRILAPSFTRRVLSRGAAARLTTKTGAEED
jgi:short-subunit dehydrogenase